MSRRVLWLAARFALAYGALTWLAAVTPVYAELERPFTAVAAALLRQSPDETRELSFERHEMSGTYRYELRAGTQGKRLERGMHAHGFVAVLFLALVAATPWLGAPRTAAAVGGGAALVLAVCVLMLMGDVVGWEAELRAALGQSPEGARPYLVPLGFVAGLHRTAAAGVLPIAYWALVTLRPGVLRG
ncbi:MAG TPA: hypothetical protein VMR86_06315 [Myxococcota bacterium]|nr:hypothetical protein [Myxococcota bacterium]